MKGIISFLCVIMVAGAFSQSPEEVVQAQLEAYNNKDIDAFMETFSDTAMLYSIGDAEPWASGEGEVRAVYTGLFEQSPDLHSEIVHRSVVGNKVMDHERITGRRGSDEPLELIMIYEVEDGKIVRAWSVR